MTRCACQTLGLEVVGGDSKLQHDVQWLTSILAKAELHVHLIVACIWANEETQVELKRVGSLEK